MFILVQLYLLTYNLVIKDKYSNFEFHLKTFMQDLYSIIGCIIYNG